MVYIIYINKTLIQINLIIKFIRKKSLVTLCIFLHLIVVSVQIEGPKRVNESENVDIMIQLNQGDRNGRVHVGITTIPGTAKGLCHLY